MRHLREDFLLARRRFTEQKDAIRDKILTVPNALCFFRQALAPHLFIPWFRIGLTPVIGALVIGEYYPLAFSLFIIAGATDLVPPSLSNPWDFPVGRMDRATLPPPAVAAGQRVGPGGGQAARVRALRHTHLLPAHPTYATRDLSCMRRGDCSAVDGRGARAGRVSRGGRVREALPHAGTADHFLAVLRPVRVVHASATDHDQQGDRGLSRLH